MIASPLYDKQAFRDVFYIMQNNKWTEDRLEELMYLLAICDTAEQKELLKELICKIFVLDDNKLKDTFSAINNKINEWGLLPQDSLIVAVADLGQSDGSAIGIKALELKIKPVVQWSQRCINNIPDSIDKIKNGDSIVLFDDFIGSGDKFTRKYNWLRTLISRKKDIDIKTLSFYFLSFSGMSFGIQRLNDEGHTVYAHNILRKGISENFDKATSSSKIKVMEQLESKLSNTFNKKKLNDFTLGYGKSEALYFWVNYSCPNNVFPIFWWPDLKSGAEHESLLVRVK